MRNGAPIAGSRGDLQRRAMYSKQIPLEPLSLDTPFLSSYTEFIQLPDFINKKGVDMKRCVLFIFLMVIIFTGTVCHAQDMGIITGNKRGTYYQFGLNLAQMVKSRGIKLNVFDSAGSVQNVYSVYKAPGVQLGIVQSDVLA